MININDKQKKQKKEKKSKKRSDSDELIEMPLEATKQIIAEVSKPTQVVNTSSAPIVDQPKPKRGRKPKDKTKDVVVIQFKDNDYEKPKKTKVADPNKVKRVNKYMSFVNEWKKSNPTVSHHDAVKKAKDDYKLHKEKLSKKN